MVSSKPEREMEEVVGKEQGEYNMLAEVERLLKDLLKFKDVLVKSIEGAEKRIDEIEKKIGQAGGYDDTEIKNELAIIKGTVSEMDSDLEGLNKTSENLDNISKTLVEIEKKAEIFSTKDVVTKAELLKIEKDIEGISKLQKEDNKFMEGMYNELKDNNSNTMGKFKETEKEMAKAKKEIEKVQAFRKALGDFVKAVIE